MCSYGGKIQPRSHDNQLSYIGGDTKILAVDRNIKFQAFLSKLSTLCDAIQQDVTFKYQLPG
ncbi:leucine-rich repeat extensin-like protein 2-like, partial [Trifolium medium]|nr:leucine-rich repeat extensin-like protein 2-like [Trifolium medium]